MVKAILNGNRRKMQGAMRSLYESPGDSIVELANAVGLGTALLAAPGALPMARETVSLGIDPATAAFIDAGAQGRRHATFDRGEAVELVDPTEISTASEEASTEVLSAERSGAGDDRMLLVRLETASLEPGRYRLILGRIAPSGASAGSIALPFDVRGDGCRQVAGYSDRSASWGEIAVARRTGTRLASRAMPAMSRIARAVPRGSWGRTP